MDFNLNDVAVINNVEAQRFEARVQNLLSLLTYRRLGNRITFVHTEVPPALERKGLAAKLTRTALDFARAENLQVIPLCPYVANYIRKHPEVQDLLAPADLRNILSRSTEAKSGS
jgi:hypothetical protein